ncbi:MAG: ATP-binding protein [Eubacteriaceae bacterium]|jgi:two-component system phosphate regulon sensor histidine kinase PhoR|nr:ATP-binding protein [Eubacteriaceae bacterium]
MNAKIMVTIILTALLNLLCAVFITDTAARGIAAVTISVVGIGLIIVFLAKPIYDMKMRLRKVQQENDELERMRSEFVSNVTHELKTPLTSISGFVETLQNGAIEDPEIRTKFIDIIAIETDRLKRLIDDVLVLSNIENEIDVPSEQIDVGASIDTVMEMMMPIAESKGIELINEVESGLTVSGDSDRFRQLFMNLVENAIKYSDEGGRVWITGYMSDGHLQMAVSDEGIGIEPENIDKIFMRFYRVDKSRSNKVGGTGLGLSIVKHIASLFGAAITVDSKVGKGSTFYVTFPEPKK